MQIGKFIKGFLVMVGVLLVITTIGGHGLGLNLLGGTNTYIQDSFLYVVPLIACFGFSIRAFRKKQNDVGAGIIFGFVISYCLFILATLWGIGEANCVRYFFDIFTNC